MVSRELVNAYNLGRRLKSVSHDQKKFGWKLDGYLECRTGEKDVEVCVLRCMSGDLKKRLAKIHDDVSKENAYVAVSEVEKAWKAVDRIGWKLQKLRQRYEELVMDEIDGGRRGGSSSIGGGGGSGKRKAAASSSHGGGDGADGFHQHFCCCREPVRCCRQAGGPRRSVLPEGARVSQ